MARLIVDEGGRARRFRLKNGRLIIGSGEGAALRLEDSGLEERHAALVVRDDEITLEMLDGSDDAWILEPGEPIELGGALLTVEADEPTADPEPQPAAAQRSPRVQSSRRSAGGSRAGARAGGRTSRTRGPAKKSGGPWILIAVLAVLGVGGWKVFESYAQYAGERGFDLQTSYNRVVSRLEEADYAGALREYEKIDTQTEMDAKWRSTFDELRARAETMRDAAALDAKHHRWTQDYLGPQLQRFEKEYLKGTPQPSRVRVFLKRARYFKENVPQHPEMDWVDRMVERYSRIVDLDDPPTYDDIAFEVESLTWAKPRDYKRAFEVLNEFLDDASGDDRAQALSLFDELAEARQAHFEDRLAQAKYDWDKGRQGEAIMWLALLVIYTGDDDMASDAARRLVMMPDVDAYLRGYAQTQPETWEKLKEHPIVSKKAAELGL